MSNIVVRLDSPIFDGKEVVFRSPADASEVTGLKVIHNNGEDFFDFADAHGETVNQIADLFSCGAVVKVILDLDNSKAFIQNADTNAYLEQKLADLAEGTGGSNIRIITWGADD